MRRSPTTRQPCLEWWTRQGSRRKNYHHSLPNPGKRSGPTMEARPIASITFSSQTWYPSINRIYKHWKWLPMCVQWFIRTYHAILKHDCSGDWKMSLKDWTEQTIKGPGIRRTFSVLFDVDEILIFSKKNKGPESFSMISFRILRGMRTEWRLEQVKLRPSYGSRTRPQPSFWPIRWVWKSGVKFINKVCNISRFSKSYNIDGTSWM